jgi:hypothetical protein
MRQVLRMVLWRSSSVRFSMTLEFISYPLPHYCRC